MKYTILVISLLYTISGIAQMKVEIIPTDSNYAKMQLDCTNVQDCDAKLLAWIDKQKSFVGTWNDTKKDHLVKRVETNLENENVTKYYHPLDFSVNIIDETEKVAKEKKDREDKKALRKSMKSQSLKKKSNESVDEWRSRVADALDEILKDMSEE